MNLFGADAFAPRPTPFTKYVPLPAAHVCRSCSQRGGIGTGCRNGDDRVTQASLNAPTVSVEFCSRRCPLHRTEVEKLRR